MLFTKIKRIFIRGIALALPLVVIGYFAKKVIETFEKLITPIAKQFGVEKIFCEITVPFWRSSRWRSLYSYWVC
jgi:hypothetical protein